MKSNELRIGNWINFIPENSDFVVSEINSFNCEKINGLEIIDLNPIPLTEEWLLRFAFEKINHIHNGEIWVHSLVKITWYPNGMIELRDSVGWSKIIYVHQLQNLYFCLTGEELTIK